ncbi:MAG: hypothetical protein COW30_02515 [Rhodospirillales bacterium CG15_BIG_FIL_POST_REV_8_21_14_020_66_15]|nr:MAG: hypothetical protein COW30_02515 [Rhodospirillales bacterium CG15_BIG_FIL_POST_REV_8_21_14_020_66_15]
MVQQSKVKLLLTATQLREVKKLIETGKATIDDLKAIVDGFGHDISRSSLGRYKQQVDRMGERMRRLREYSEVLAPEMSDAIKQSKQTRMLVDLVQGLLFDLVDKLETGEGADSKDIALLGKGLADLSRTLRLSQEFEKEIRETIAKEEREKAADAAGERMTEAGLSADQVKFWREEFLGVRKSKDEDKSG